MSFMPPLAALFLCATRLLHRKQGTAIRHRAAMQMPEMAPALAQTKAATAERNCHHVRLYTRVDVVTLEAGRLTLMEAKDTF